MPPHSYLSLGAERNMLIKPFAAGLVLFIYRRLSKVGAGAQESMERFVFMCSNIDVCACALGVRNVNSRFWGGGGEFHHHSRLCICNLCWQHILASYMYGIHFGVRKKWRFGSGCWGGGSYG